MSPYFFSIEFSLGELLAWANALEFFTALADENNQ